MRSVEFEIERQVIKILSNCFSEGGRKIESSSRLVEDLCVDSMSFVEIVMVLNDEYCIEMPASEVAKWRVVSDICCSVVREKINFLGE